MAVAEPFISWALEQVIQINPVFWVYVLVHYVILLLDKSWQRWPLKF